MRAIWLTELGDPEVLVPGDAPDPVAGDGQVVVEVAFTNITFIETQLRSGRMPGLAPPVVPGNGVGGVVVEVGLGVDPTLVGTRVVTSTGGSGAYAERVAVDAAGLVDVPGGLALDDAVALLADGRTATWLVRTAGVGEGDRVLVEAAAGGVGTLLVQLARNAGARVVAAAGGDRKLELARELGAEIAVDYRKPGWADDVRAAVGGVDVVFDGVGAEIGRQAFELAAPGARMVAYGLAGGQFSSVTDDEAAARGVTVTRGARITPEEARELTRSALAEAAAGRLRPVIGQRFPLARAADAHAAIEARTTIGKTLLIP